MWSVTFDISDFKLIHDYFSLIHFLTLFYKDKMYLFIRFVCLSVHAPTLVNILQIPWNSCMSFISDIAYTELEPVDIGLMVRLHRGTKEFRYIVAYERKFLKILH